MGRDEETGLEHEGNLVADLERALAEPTSLCRYEDMAKRENRLRAVEARSVKPPN